MEELAAVGKSRGPNACLVDTPMKASSASFSNQGSPQLIRRSSVPTASPARRPPTMLMETVASHDIQSKSENLEATPSTQPFMKPETLPTVAGNSPSTTASVCRWTSSASLGSISSHFRAKLALLHRCPYEASHKPPIFPRRVQRFRFKRWVKKMYRKAKSHCHQPVKIPVDAHPPQIKRTERYNSNQGQVTGGGASKRVKTGSHWVPKGRIAKRAGSNSWLLRARGSKTNK